MRVSELITRLTSFPSNHEVVVWYDSGARGLIEDVALVRDPDPEDIESPEKIILITELNTFAADDYYIKLNPFEGGG